MLEYMSRTFCNSTETLVSTIAFYLWKKRNHKNYCDFYSRLLVTIGFIMRPTIILLWAPIWIYQLFTMQSTLKDKIWFIGRNLLTIFIFFSSAMIINFYFQGQILSIELNFFKINILQNISAKFGQSSIWQYGLLLAKILNILLIPLLIALKNILFAKNQRNYQFKELILFTSFVIIFFSLLSHKQMRFLMFILPLIFIIANKGFTILYRKVKILYILISIIIHSVNFYISSLYLSNTGLIMLNDLRNDISIKSILLINKVYSIPLYCVLHKNIKIISQNINPIECKFFFLKKVDDSSIRYRAQVLDQFTYDDPQKMHSYIIIQQSQNWVRTEENNIYLAAYYDKINHFPTKNFYGFDYIEVYKKKFDQV